MKIHGNPIIQGASGTLGDAVFRQRKGKLVVGKRPKLRESSSPAQEGVKLHFTKASYYAKAQVADPISKAEYETGMTDDLPSPYQVAFADYLKGPIIDTVEAGMYTGEIGSNLRISALDNFKVVSVEVQIYSSANVLIESGMAVQDQTDLPCWVYTATAQNTRRAGSKIIIVAKDKPRNTTTKEVIL